MHSNLYDFLGYLCESIPLELDFHMHENAKPAQVITKNITLENITHFLIVFLDVFFEEAKLTHPNWYQRESILRS
jgi:hypothetical protein